MICVYIYDSSSRGQQRFLSIHIEPPPGWYKVSPLKLLLEDFKYL